MNIISMNSGVIFQEERNQAFFALAQNNLSKFAQILNSNPSMPRRNQLEQSFVYVAVQCTSRAF